MGDVIAVTMDVDFTAYHADAPLDELAHCFPAIRDVCRDLPEVRFTWFVRVDAHLAATLGRSDYAFAKHPGAMEWLRAAGHELGWHHHAYREDGGRWVPEWDESRVVDQMRCASDIAKAMDLSVARMGWGFHSNATMAEMERLEWLVDSSAIPRPRYGWAPADVDWSTTPQHPYRPSRADYRVPGAPDRALLELPITTVELPVDTDTQRDVRRYINPSYHTPIFERALDQVEADDDTVLVCHPYEVCPSDATHPLISFDTNVFRHNIELVLQRFGAVSTLSEIVERVNAR